jgi:hypothetical protein
MSKIEYIDPIKSMHGKIHSQSDTWLMERYGTKFTGHRTHPRDYSLKPQSEAEKAGTLRMAAASKAYNQIIKGSPEWVALEQEYQAQLSQPGAKKTIRGYFISKHMKGGS